jgi:hypothetical protein
LRAHGGKIAEDNRIRSAVSGSARLSFTRGAITSTAPALVTTVRGCAEPLRTTRRRPVLVPHAGELVDVGGDLSLQRRGQHLPRTLPHDLINQRRRRTLRRRRGRHVRDYCEHGCTFPASVAAPAFA